MLCTYLDHSITLDVILEALELQVQDWRERLKDDAFLGILQTITLSHVLVVAIQGLNSYVIFERLIKVLHSLDIQLNICGQSQIA